MAGLLRGELDQAERCGVGRGGVEWVPGGGRIGSCEEEMCPGWSGMAVSQAERRSRGNSGRLRCAELSEDEKGLQFGNPRVRRGC